MQACDQQIAHKENYQHNLRVAFKEIGIEPLAAHSYNFHTKFQLV
jgi:hypothetical protein